MVSGTAADSRRACRPVKTRPASSGASISSTLRDSGICHALLGIGSLDALLGHPVAGGSWEGLVIENIVGCLPTHASLGYYRTAGGAEIDLVIEFGGGETWAVEVKRSTAPRVTRGFHSACEDLQTARKLVVYPGHESFPLGRGIEAFSLKGICDELG